MTKQTQSGNLLRFNDFVQADRSRVPPPINNRSHEMNFSTEHDYSQVVSPESLERELKRVRAAAAGAAQGVFGPRPYRDKDGTTQIRCFMPGAGT
jgi:hypothetical protein